MPFSPYSVKRLSLTLDKIPFYLYNGGMGNEKRRSPGSGRGRDDKQNNGINMKVQFSWNGPKSQARPYMESIERVQEFRERQNKKADALIRYGERLRKTWGEREAFERRYFGEIV